MEPSSTEQESVINIEFTIDIFKPISWLIFILVSLPALGLAWKWQSSQVERRGDWKNILRIFLLASAAGVVVVKTTQLVLTYLVVWNLGCKRFPSYVGLPSNLPCILPVGFARAGLAEEVIKYLSVAVARRRFPAHRGLHERAYVDYAIAAAMGLTTTRNLWYMLADVGAGSRGVKLVLTLVERIALITTFYALLGYMTASRAWQCDFRKKHWPLWEVVGPSLILRFFHDCLLAATTSKSDDSETKHGNEVFVIRYLVTGFLSLTVALYIQRRSRTFLKGE